MTGVDVELVYFVFLLVGCAVCGVMIYALRVFQQMLKPMKNGAPFDSTVAHGFHKLGWFTIIVGVAVNLLEPIMVNVLIPMETLSGSGTTPRKSRSE